MPVDPPSPFTGFGPSTVSFLAELQANNDKAWFDDHRDRYRDDWLAPARSFTAAAGEALSELAPDVVAQPKVNGSIFRINRDIRFTKDKSPYKGHLDLWFWEGATRAEAVSGFYLRLAPDRVGVGIGAHRFDPSTLARYRQLVVDPKAGASLRDAVAEVSRAGFEVEGENLKRTPKGLDTPGDPAQEALLRHTALWIGHDLPHPKVLGQSRFVSWCMTRWRMQLPLHRWLVDHLQ